MDQGINSTQNYSLSSNNSHFSLRAKRSSEPNFVTCIHLMVELLGREEQSIIYVLYLVAKENTTLNPHLPVHLLINGTVLNHTSIPQNTPTEATVLANIKG